MLKYMKLKFKIKGELIMNNNFKNFERSYLKLKHITTWSQDLCCLSGGQEQPQPLST